MKDISKATSVGIACGLAFLFGGPIAVIIVGAVLITTKK